MSALKGVDALADLPADAQIVVCHYEQFDVVKRLFHVLPVVASNGADTDFAPIYGHPCVLIGKACEHAMLLSIGGVEVKCIEDDPDPFWETPDALQWAKQNAQIYKPTVPAQDATEEVLPFSDSLAPDAETTLPEMPSHLLDGPPVDALHYPDSSAFTPDEIPVAVEWREPRNIFGDEDVLAFGEGMLPSWLSDYIADVSYRRGTAAAFTAVGTQVALSKACDPAFKLQPMMLADDYVVIPCLWGVAVGPSSAGKDPGLNAAIGPLRELDMKLRIEVVQKDKEFSRRYRKWQKQEQDWINAKEKDGAGNDTFEIPEPKREPDKRLVFSDINIPSLGEFLADGHPRGALVFNSEISTWLGSFDAYSKGSGERGHWLAAYEGGSNVIRRITRGEIHVPNFLAGILGGITPSALRGALGKGTLNEDGLLQRMLIGMGGPQGRVIDAVPDKVAAETYKRVLERLIEWDGDPDRRFVLSSGASELYQEFLEEVRQLIELGDHCSGMQSHLGKLRGMVARQCLTMHLANYAHSGKYPSYDIPIPTQTMAQSVAFFRWQIGHIEAFWKEITGAGGVSRQQSAEQKLALYILGNRATEIRNDQIDNNLKNDWRMPELTHAARNAARAKILENLNEAGWISTRWSGARKFNGYGTVHDINPAVYDVFRDIAQAERERRDAVVALLARRKEDAKAARG